MYVRRLYGRKFRFTATRQNENSDHITDDIPPQMNILNSYPIIVAFLYVLSIYMHAFDIAINKRNSNGYW